MSRRVRRAAGLVAVLLCLLPSAAVAHLDPYSLQGDFICISCHEPLNQVNSPESQAEKTTLAQLADRGLSLDQIKTQMVADYGEQVLAEPPAHGLNLLVYLLPPIVVVLGLGFIAYNVPRWRRRARTGIEGDPGGSHEVRLDPGDAARLDAELRAFRG